MATQFPASTPAPFGIPAAETGIIADSVGYNYSHEKKQLRDIDGDTIAVSLYDERCEVSLSGFLPGASPFSTSLASAITLVTAVPDFFKGSVGGLTIVESVNRTNSSEEYQRIEVTASHHPLVTA